MTLPIDDLCDYYLRHYPVKGDTLTVDDVAEDARVLATALKKSWNIIDAILPQLTPKEMAALDAIPADAVDHWMRGERWDGEKWVQRSLTEVNR